MFGSVGVGKSLILKAIHLNYSRSEIFHFTDLYLTYKITMKKN